MAFSVPFNSSPPTTPEARQRNRFGPAANRASNTPAGLPPPSSARSFTPLGSPPSTILGSSQLGSQQSLFGARTNGKPAQSSPLAANASTISTQEQRSHDDAASQAQTRSEFIAHTHGTQSGNATVKSRVQETVERDEDTLAPELGLTGPGMDLDFNSNQLPNDRHFSVADSIYDWGQHGSSTRSFRSSKTRRGPRAARTRDRARASYSTLANTFEFKDTDPSSLQSLAKSTAQSLGIADLNEPHSLILATEKEVRRIYPDDNSSQDHDEVLTAALRVVPDTLARAWQRCCKEEDDGSDIDDQLAFQIGPGDDLPSYHKASFVGNLLLKLHHPPPARGKQAPAAFRASRRAIVPFAETYREEAYPQILFEWLDQNHNPYAEVVRTLGSYQPDPTAHPTFWDSVLSSTLRGRISDVIRLLKGANFQYARTAEDDGFGREGYSAQVLSTIEREVQRAVQTLSLCPAVTDDDWHVVNFAWAEYRLKVENALEELIATSERTGSDPKESAFDASQLNLRSSLSEFARSTKQREVKMPRTIFRNLRQLYNILLGSTNELVAAAQDWLEATVALTAWWDGEAEEDTLYSLSASAPSRQVDAEPGYAYRKRLYNAFKHTTRPGDGESRETWQIDSNSPVEVALASIFEQSLDGVFSLLQSFSLPIASAIMEIGTIALWFRPQRSTSKIDGLDNNDLMVLNYSQPERAVSKGEFLSAYADQLFEIPQLEWNSTSKEGWELAIEILSRIDDARVADTRIGELIVRIDVESDQRADKLIGLCRLFNLDAEGNKVSEKYGDYVAETSDRYGTALIYYARASNTKKVRDVLSLLISYCLVQSTSFPPVANLDPHLASLLSQPRGSLQFLAKVDPTAAEILSLNMSGYATLRKFYDTRDEASGNEERPLSNHRKKTAAAALLMVVSSAASWVVGGIFDPASDAIVPFEVLLVLLGEVMPFVDTHVRFLSLTQIMVLLRAIEDLQTVHPRIRSQCEACLKSTLAAKDGRAAQLADPQAMLKKSISGMTGSSGFSLVDESESGKGSQTDGGIRRGWDWREGLLASAKKRGDRDDSARASAKIIGMLRLGLAREVSRAWLDGEELELS